MKSRYLSPDEIRRIHGHLPEGRRLIFDVALATGMRIGDVLKIRRGDVSQDGDGVVIRYIAQKTGKKGRAVINGTVAVRFYAFARQKRGFLWASDAKCGHFTRQSAWKWYKDAARSVGVSVDGVSPHALRKSFAAALRHERGIEAARIALQHSDNVTTAIYAYSDVYAGADPSAPILWCQIEQLLDLIIERINEQKK